jgi:hypothetical protein
MWLGTSGVYHFPSTDWKHSDHVFGAVLITAERKPLSEITHEFLKEGWTSDIEESPLNKKGVLWTFTVPDKSQRTDEWSAEQVWGYAEHDIPGLGREKRYTRKIHFISPTLIKDVLLVYDSRDVESTISTEEEEDLASFGAS